MRTSFLLTAALASLFATHSSAQDLPNGHGYGGGVRTRAPLDDAPLRVSAASGWGRYRDAGVHDRVSGRLSVVGWATPWLSLGARVDGTLDVHPDDDQGSDRSLQGEPALLVGASHRTPTWGVGLLIDVRLPGANAPSLQLSATTPEARVWGAWRGPLTLMGNLGFRLDRTAKALDIDPDMLRPGDRRALLVSDADSMILSIAASVPLGTWEPVVEVGWEPWIGESPGLRYAPLRLSGALRAHIGTTTLSVGIEGRLTSNAPIVPGTLVPLEPRVRVFVDVNFGLLRPRIVPEEVVNAPPRAERVQPEVVTPPRAEGTVRDDEGNALPGATVQLREGDTILDQTTTDAAGGFQLTLPTAEPLPALRVALLDDDGTVVAEIAIGPGVLDLRRPTAEPRTPMGTLRGLVRNFAGEPVRAHVAIGDVDAETDEEGRFEVDLPPGSHDVSLRADGYRSQTRSVQVDDDGVTILNVELRPSRR